MTVNVHDSAIVFLQNQRHRIQRLREFGFDIGFADVKRDVGGHIEHNVVAHAGNRDACVLQLSAQFGFLLVHIIADSAPRERAHARSDQCADTGITANRRADNGTPDGTAALRPVEIAVLRNTAHRTFVYAGLGIVAFLFFAFKVPETKDKTLEQLQRELVKD